jgi:L-arabinose isomerase
VPKAATGWPSFHLNDREHLETGYWEDDDAQERIWDWRDQSAF